VTASGSAARRTTISADGQVATAGRLRPPVQPFAVGCAGAEARCVSRQKTLLNADLLMEIDEYQPFGSVAMLRGLPTTVGRYY